MFLGNLGAGRAPAWCSSRGPRRLTGYAEQESRPGKWTGKDSGGVSADPNSDKSGEKGSRPRTVLALLMKKRTGLRQREATQRNGPPRDRPRFLNVCRAESASPIRT